MFEETDSIPPCYQELDKKLELYVNDKLKRNFDSEKHRNLVMKVVMDFVNRVATNTQFNADLLEVYSSRTGRSIAFIFRNVHEAENYNMRVMVIAPKDRSEESIHDHKQSFAAYCVHGKYEHELSFIMDNENSNYFMKNRKDKPVKENNGIVQRCFSHMHEEGQLYFIHENCLHNVHNREWVVSVNVTFKNENHSDTRIVSNSREKLNNTHRSVREHTSDSLMFKFLNGVVTTAMKIHVGRNDDIMDGTYANMINGLFGRFTTAKEYENGTNDQRKFVVRQRMIAPHHVWFGMRKVYKWCFEITLFNSEKTIYSKIFKYRSSSLCLHELLSACLPYLALQDN